MFDIHEYVILKNDSSHLRACFHWATGIPSWLPEFCTRVTLPRDFTAAINRRYLSLGTWIVVFWILRWDLSLHEFLTSSLLLNPFKLRQLISFLISVPVDNHSVVPWITTWICVRYSHAFKFVRFIITCNLGCGSHAVIERGQGLTTIPLC